MAQTLVTPPPGGEEEATRPADEELSPVESRDRWSRPPVVAGLLLALLGASLALRIEGLPVWYWMDEGISIGIASHPPTEIPGLLRQDGSPPLYYFLLHGWMRLFGSTEPATHALSLLIASAAVVAALWAGWSLFGRATGWVLAVLAASNPFISGYSGETRMYSLVVLLSIVATAAFVHTFAFGRRRYLPVLVVSLTLLLYTHNWGLWFAAAAVAALGPCLWVAPDRRRLLRDAAIGFGVTGLLYLPWLPSLLFQAAHNGAPWSAKPVPREAVSVTAGALGDERVLVALLLVAGATLWNLARRGSPEEAAALRALAVLVGGTLSVAWLAAQVASSWSLRYVAVYLPAMLLLAAVGLVRSGTRGWVALALVLAFWVQPLGRVYGLRRPVRPNVKAGEKSLARAVEPQLRAGDLVVVMQMEEVPVLRHYLGDGLQFATAMGPVADPLVPDWRNALEKMRATTPATALTPLVDAMEPGQRLLLVCAQPGTGPPDLPWFELMERRCTQWKTALFSDDRLTSMVPAQIDRLRNRSVLLFSRNPV